MIGGGIAGMQAALDLGEQGFEVLLVEKEPSIGGIMVGLNKVFPTLDCSSCICTPRMAEAAHHDAHPAPDLHRGASGSSEKATGFRVAAAAGSRATSSRTTASAAASASSPARSTSPTSSTTAWGRGGPIYIPHGNAIPQKAVLDVEHCVFCGKCEKVCPTDCIDYRAGAGGGDARRSAR